MSLPPKAQRVQLWLKDCRCHHCGRPTVLYPYTARNKDPIPDDAATIDHLESRLNPNRGSIRGRRHVLSCHRCNRERNEREQAAVPREVLHARAHPAKRRCGILSSP